MIVLITLLVGLMCLAYFGIEDSGHHGEDELSGLHVIAGFALVGALALKVIVVRWWHALGTFLPLIGISVLILFFLTWLSSSATYLWGR